MKLIEKNKKNKNSNFEMTLKADKKLMFYDSLQHKPPHNIYIFFS